MGQGILSHADSRRRGLGTDGHGQICPGFPVRRSVGQNGFNQWRVFILRQTQAISDVASPSQRTERAKALDLGQTDPNDGPLQKAENQHSGMSWGHGVTV